MNRRIFITAIPFLPALFLKPKPDTNSTDSNQVHIDNIRRETAKLRAIAELTRIEHEKDLLRKEFWKSRKFDGFDF